MDRAKPNVVENCRSGAPGIAGMALVQLTIAVIIATGAVWAAPPVPLLAPGKPVNWWFVFKFNTGAAPGCAGTAARVCRFGGDVKTADHFSQQFAFASSARPTLTAGGGCLGDTSADPVGATFDQIYNGKFFFVVWNDQFDGHPIQSRGAPAGHSKGILAWDDSGAGVVMQVTTPSWPGSGTADAPRQGDGNTLGCIEDNNVLVSQHFFAARLKKGAVATMLKALVNANVVTDITKPQLARNGGPAEIQDLVGKLGTAAKSTTPTMDKLPGGVVVISKPSGLHLPPWQLTSAMLGGEPLRVATWWHAPLIPTTTSTTEIGCWLPSLSALGKPGPVEIATTGTWDGKTIGLKGTASAQGNHAKIGVSTGTKPLAIFGDLNQQGALSGGPSQCDSSQNGRGGLFFVVNNRKLAASVGALLKGETAPAQ
ncbi:MAG: hypothetical protein NTZ56_09790 [Acidobacteria bacterium]|nr:hypothetical protein [Acidobacteriota bacterium]